MTAAVEPDLEYLTRRLAEAEGTIQALLGGQVDAVVRSENKAPLLLEKAQAALRASEGTLRFERDRAQRQLDSAEVILMACDLSGRITLVNRYACSLLGWTAEELVGRDFFDTCIPARLRSAVRETYAKVVGGDRSVVENLIVTKSGEERLIEWRNRPTTDENGNTSGGFTSGTDITDRNKHVEALRVAEERMRFALDSADVGIWDLDYSTGNLKWTERLEAHYGLEPGAFPGTFDAFVERIYPEDRDAVLATVGEAMKTGTDFVVRNRSLWPDGSMHWLNGAGRIQLDGQGRPVRGVGISIDVTEQRNLEEQFQIAQRMEAVGRLAGGVAHDFNNLLMIITGYTDMLLQGMIAGDSRRHDLDQIRKAADGAAALTHQLLAFSRRQVIRPVLVVLEEVVGGTTDMLKRLIGEDIDLVTSLSHVPANVLIDPGQLEQVIMNLVVNARDAMPTGGKITIETSTVELTESDAVAHWPITAGRFALLTVSDTGIGMNEQTRAQIFEPFFTTKDQGKGTGLGLATVYGIIKQSGGFIWVYSEPNKGATFKVYLPLLQGDPDVRHIAAIQAPLPRGFETILLVEDSEGVRDIARRVLERQGYTVIEAPNAREALERARAFNGKIHLLLTDVVMPEMSGRVLSESFAEFHPNARVLFMSGYTDDAVVRHGVLRAETPYLQKPFSPQALAIRVREILDAT